jgi:hypothetical protein
MVELVLELYHVQELEYQSVGYWRLVLVIWDKNSLLLAGLMMRDNKSTDSADQLIVWELAVGRGSEFQKG